MKTWPIPHQQIPCSSNPLLAIRMTSLKLRNNGDCETYHRPDQLQTGIGKLLSPRTEASNIHQKKTSNNNKDEDSNKSSLREPGFLRAASA